jgi:hypothetical protein
MNQGKPFSKPFLFFLSDSIAVTYIFTAPTTCTTTIIPLEPCALRFNKISLLCRYH